jgi:hypothetical protein
MTAEERNLVIENLSNLGKLMQMGETSLPLAGIFFGMSGVVTMGREAELFKFLRPYYENQMKELINIKAQQN